MENDEPNDLGDDFSVDSNCSAVNKLILDYYKKFGRKRDIEQFFSLSTAQQDLSEPSSLFWKKMKEQNDSSDSGDKKTGSSTEVCRISIKCSMEDPNSSKIYNKNTDSDTESPPIISDDVPDKCFDSGDESNKSEGEHSYKSNDMTLDTSLNRPHSPTSSITFQRKLEWDSLADVGYGNESDRKNSASSLSTLERLALHQQYSNNDTKPNSDLGIPTDHSTPLDQTESKSKFKKDGNKRTSKFGKSVDIMEVNIPHTSDNTNQPINVNLTKHISFNVEKDGIVKMDNITKNIPVSRDNLTPDAQKNNVDKQIQTSLPRNSKDNAASPAKHHSSRPRFPILINLNTIRNRKKKQRRKLSRPRKRGTVDKENIPQEKSINQESDAESFEYMPGHMYNQNKLECQGSVSNVADNKSSLESSAGHTTESSKDSQCTFTKELEKSINLLKLALQHRYKDTSLKKKLIKEVVQSLVQTNYKNDGTSMFESNQNNQIASSTSDGNNIDGNKAKKSILETEKFNSGEIATTSQSAPNLPIISTAINHKKKSKPVSLSSTDSDLSYKSKYLSEVFLANSSSEEIYKKYLIALKKENLYKKKLKEQELLLRQKTTQQSEQVCQVDAKTKSNLNHLIKDLTRNNFADGSGDASNACPSSSNVENGSGERSKSHTVFTLSGGNNDFKKNKKLKNRLESEMNCSKEAGSSTQCQVCPTYRREKIVVTDSSVQANFGSQCITKTDNLVLEQSTPLSNEKLCYENSQENIKYVCLCSEHPNEVPDNFLIYKCSRLPSKCIMVGRNIKTDICPDQKSENMDLVYKTCKCESKDLLTKKISTTSTQSSQTHFIIPKLLGSSCNKDMCFSSDNINSNKTNNEINKASLKKVSCDTCKDTILTQTEISIDPKISDPSISDIKIIENEAYCKDNEQERNVSDVGASDVKKECNEIYNDAKYSQIKNDTIEGAVSKYSPIEGDVICRPEKHKKLEENYSKLISLQNLQPHSNFTIPIHGTNMTLKVSLDSRDFQEKKTKDIKSTYSQEYLGSKRVKSDYCALQSDYLRQKGTECVSIQTSNIGEQKDIADEINICYLDAKDGQRPTTSGYRYESVDMEYCNTHPKENTPKVPLLRSNTDTGKMEYFDSCLPTDKKIIDTKKKSLNELLLKSQAGSSISPKNSLLRGKTDSDKKKFIDQYTLLDTKNDDPEEEISKNVLIKSTPEPNKVDFFGRHTSIGTKQKEPQNTKNTEGNPKYGGLVQPLLRSNLDSDKIEYFDRHTSMGKENVNSKERTLRNPLVRLNTDSGKKEVSDRHTSIGKENEHSIEPLPKCNSDKINSNVPINRKDIDTQYDYNLTTQIKTKETATQIIDSSKSYTDTIGSGRQKSSEHSEKTHFSTLNTKKEVSDLHTLIGKENENLEEPLPKCNSDKINSNVPINRKDVDAQYDYYLTTQIKTKETATQITDSSKSSSGTRGSGRQKSSEHSEKTHFSTLNTDDSKSSTQDPLLDIIRDITKRYSKKDVDKSKRKKCYAEIIAVLNYLLDTSGTTENESTKARISSASEHAICDNRSPHRSKSSDKPKKTLQKDISNYNAHDFQVDDTKKIFKDKGVQPSPRKSKQNKCCGELIDCPISTDIYSASSDSAVCRTQHKLKYHCEKHRYCNSHCKKCDISSSSSVNDPCKYRCYCRGHKSHRSRTSEKAKKCVAYNLILQTSDSIASEEIDKQRVERHLKNIVVKVPSKRRVENMQFKEVTQKIERDLPQQFVTKDYCVRNLPQDNEVSSTDNIMKNTATCTIRDYLEHNRPDFVERSTQRQSCLKLINEARHECDTHLNMIVVRPPTCVRNKMTSMYCEGVIDNMGCPCNECVHKLYCVQNEVMGVASDRATKREVLSAHVARAAVAEPSDADLRRLAEIMGKDLRTRKLAPKFISEKEMKRHSEKIYKSLPEVQRKKEEIKKERIKKTNLLMANMFKKNLQKKALRGAVNLSNYSAVIKI